MSMPSKFTSCCLPVLAALAVALVPQLAQAQVEPAAPWGFNGSDTLETVMKDAIVAARGAGVLAATGKHCVGTSVAAAVCTSDADCTAPATCLDTNTLVYLGGGSGTAETNIQAAANKQVLAPMSRNLTQGALTANPFFAPNLRNVLGLDAAVIVTGASSSRVKNLTIPLQAGSLTVAADNTSPAGYNWSTPASGYTQLLEVVLSGVDGSGSVPACANPRRLQAIQDLAAAQGTTSGTINHFYRRDDNSGTTATFQERAKVQRFCNGRARGVLGTITANPNLNNQDFDPIRRPCDALLPGQRATSCTDMTTGLACQATDNNPNCTQGLVVALSVGDNSAIADVTETIASRVANDPDSMGFAGREAVRLPAFLTAGPALNRLPFDDSIVRSVGTPYLLARRLFLNYADADGDPTTLATPRTLATFGGAPRVTAETALYDWMTSETNNPTGRCNIDPIMKARGFLACKANCADDISTDPDNFCNGPYDPGFSAPANCIPNSTNGTQWGHGPVACTAGQICCSTGLACPASNQCPAANARPVDSACGKNADCSSNNCSDYRFINTLMCAP